MFLRITCPFCWEDAGKICEIKLLFCSPLYDYRYFMFTRNFFKCLICLSLLFQHITKSIRDLLGIEDPSWSKSISLPPRDELGLFTSALYYLSKDQNDNNNIKNEEKCFVSRIIFGAEECPRRESRLPDLCKLSQRL